MNIILKSKVLFVVAISTLILSGCNTVPRNSSLDESFQNNSKSDGWLELSRALNQIVMDRDKARIEKLEKMDNEFKERMASPIIEGFGISEYDLLHPR